MPHIKHSTICHTLQTQVFLGLYIIIIFIPHQSLPTRLLHSKICNAHFEEGAFHYLKYEGAPQFLHDWLCIKNV